MPELVPQFSYNVEVTRHSPERGEVLVHGINEDEYSSPILYDLTKIEGAWRAYSNHHNCPEHAREINLGRRSFWMTVKDIVMLNNPELEAPV